MGESALSTKEQAEKIQLSLDPNVPSFVKVMQYSHVAGGFWMGIPRNFSVDCMSERNISMTLSDEECREFKIHYLAERSGISGGWQGFVKAHHLRAGDALVFQLVNLDKFKVYITRSQGGNTSEDLNQEEKRATKRLRVASAIIEENLPLKFEDNYNLERFTRILNKLVGNELTEDVKGKYYKMCCSQNSFIHIKLGHGHSYNFVAGIINETVNIVDGVKSCKLGDNFTGELTAWRKKLEEFETLGMNVGFLIPKLDEISENVRVSR